MGCKDLRMLFLLVWLFLGHSFEVWAQPASPSEVPPPPPGVPPPPPGAPSPTLPDEPQPRNSTSSGAWKVTGKPESFEIPIIKILMSSDKNFSFNLLLTNRSSSSCAATVQHTLSSTTVWVANFNASNPNAQENSGNPTVTCFLYFTERVGLVLNNTNGNKEIWSTRELNGKDFDRLQLGNDGCLSIIDAKGSANPVWKSFDYPTDTLIRGQRLVVGTSMVAAHLNQEYSTGGIFSMRVNKSDVTLYEDFGVSNTSYRSVWNTTQNISYVAIENGLMVVFDGGDQPLFSYPNATGREIWDYARLESNGGLLLSSYDSRWQSQLFNANDCSLPAKCGSFGICSLDFTCNCPGGFERANVGANFTCQRAPALNRSECSSDKFISITGMTYLNISNVPVSNDMNATDCENLCKVECNCTNALHVRRFENSSSGVCYPNLDSMQTIRKTVDDRTALQMLFLRIPGTGVVPGVGASTKSSRRTAASAFAGGAGAFVLVLLALSAWWLVRLRRKFFDDAERGEFDSVAAAMPPSQLPPQFTYKQIGESTSDFAQRLGCGGFSSVYAGHLPDGTKIAVKNLDDNGQKEGFLAAVATIGSLSHVNLVPLLGFCKEGKHKMLVYELVNEGRSLNWFLFHTHDSGPLIDAQTRRSIALGAARGLAHLHEDYNTGGVLHGGVKPENIMIDREMRPKLVDYGLVTLMTRFQTLNSAHTRGSRAYMAPEWVKSAPITSKVDVYSLGVVILELVSGRRCLIPSASPEEKRFLPTWGFSLLRRGNGDPDSVRELVDSRLDIRALSEVDQQVLMGMTFVALWCVQEDPSQRPSMHHVVKMLEGDFAVDTPPLSPALDAFARDLCAAQGGERFPESRFMQSPSLSENSDLRPR